MMNETHFSTYQIPFTCLGYYLHQGGSPAQKCEAHVLRPNEPQTVYKNKIKHVLTNHQAGQFWQPRHQGVLLEVCALTVLKLTSLYSKFNLIELFTAHDKYFGTPCKLLKNLKERQETHLFKKITGGTIISNLLVNTLSLCPNSRGASVKRRVLCQSQRPELSCWDNV